MTIVAVVAVGRAVVASMHLEVVAVAVPAAAAAAAVVVEVDTCSISAMFLASHG